MQTRSSPLLHRRFSMDHQSNANPIMSSFPITSTCLNVLFILVAGANKQYYVQPYISAKKQRKNGNAAKNLLFCTITSSLNYKFSLSAFIPLFINPSICSNKSDFIVAPIGASIKSIPSLLACLAAGTKSLSPEISIIC